MDEQEHYMKESVRTAREGMEKGEGGPFGAIVVRNGEIIGRSSNRVFSTKDPTAHAEIEAIREASKHLQNAELTGCEIYSLGEPCPMCLAAIYWAKIEKVYYANTKEEAARVGFDDSFIYKELSLSPAERSVSMKHFPRDEAREVFKDWDKYVDKSGLPQT